MADRTVAVKYEAIVTDFVAKVAQMKAAQDDFVKDTARVAQDHTEQTQKLGTGFLVAGAAIAAGLAVAVKASADFEKQISQVAAVSGAGANDLNSLRQAAIDAGAATSFSAKQAAEAETELAKIGLSTSEILGGALTGSLNLAAAGGISLADAATYAGQTMKIFKLSGADVGHIADVLASGANRSAADVSTLAQALQQSGLQASQTGLSLEDTIGTLALFSDNALNGSDAGTSFKTMLSRLVPQTEEQSTAMKALGISFFDANGNFVGIEKTAQILQQRLGNLTVEQRQATLATVFGSDAIRAASILYDAGAEGVQKYVDSVNDQGAAARVAAINLDNLSGDVETLRGSLETGLIQTGSTANNVLRDLVQIATGAVNAFNGMPRGAQAAGVGIAAVASATLLTGGALISIIPKIQATRLALASMGTTATAVRGLLGGPLGLALAAGAVAVGIFAKSQLDAKHAADDLRASLDQQTGAITDQTKAIVIGRLQQQKFTDESGNAFSSLDLAKSLGLQLDAVTDAALGNANAISYLDANYRSAKSSLEAMQKQAAAGQDVDFDALQTLTTQVQGYETLRKEIGSTTDVLNPQIEAQKQAAEAAGTASEATDGLTASQYAAAQSAKADQQATEDLRKAVKSYGSAVESAIEANLSFQESLDNATDAIAKNKATHDADTEAGRANTRALLDVADAAKANAVAMFENGSKIADVTAKTLSARDQFIQLATKMNYSKAEASKLADQLGLTAGNVSRLGQQVTSLPNGKQITITVVDLASAKARAVADALNALHDRTINVVTQTQQKNIASGGGATGLQFQATGGLLTGPGTATSDSIPVMASTGEYVVQAKAVDFYGPKFFDSLNAMKLAYGGYVGRSSSSTPGHAAAVPAINVGQIVTADPREAMRELDMTIATGMAAHSLGPL